MIDWTKPLQTKDGRKARLIGKVITTGSHPYVVAVLHKSGSEVAYDYTEDGLLLYSPDSHPGDLVNVPDKIKLHCSHVSEQNPDGYFECHTARNSCLYTGGFFIEGEKQTAETTTQEKSQDSEDDPLVGC